MKIQYTLPGYEPEVLPLSEAEEESSTSFERLMRAPQPLEFSTWTQALSLDQIPADPTYFGPPPKPSSLELRDVRSERLRWRQLLNKASIREGSSNGHASSKVNGMLTLLSHAQGAADDVWTHTFAASGG